MIIQSATTPSFPAERPKSAETKPGGSSGADDSRNLRRSNSCPDSFRFCMAPDSPRAPGPIVEQPPSPQQSERSPLSRDSDVGSIQKIDDSTLINAGKVLRVGLTTTFGAVAGAAVGAIKGAMTGSVSGLMKGWRVGTMESKSKAAVLSGCLGALCGSSLGMVGGVMKNAAKGAISGGQVGFQFSPKFDQGSTFNPQTAIKSKLPDVQKMVKFCETKYDQLTHVLDGTKVGNRLKATENEKQHCKQARELFENIGYIHKTIAVGVGILGGAVSGAVEGGAKYASKGWNGAGDELNERGENSKYFNYPIQFSSAIVCSIGGIIGGSLLGIKGGVKLALDKTDEVVQEINQQSEKVINLGSILQYIGGGDAHFT